MFKIFQSDGVTEVAEGSVIRARGTAAETISFTIVLIADQSISDVTIATHSLSGASTRSLEPAAIEIYIAKKWQQAGVGIYRSSPMLVEELLLKDDRISLTDSYKRTVRHWRHIFNPSYSYQPPVLPQHTEVRTGLDSGQAKKVFVRIKIPPAAQPAIFENAILIQVDGGSHRNLPIQIEVLPFKLLQPPQEFFLWYKGRLDWRCQQHYVPESVYRLQVQDIFEHGFTSIFISETSTDYSQRAIDIIEETGFERFVVLVPPFPELKKLKFRKTTPVLYVSDELDTRLQFPAAKENPDTLITHHRLNWRLAHEHNAKSMASLLTYTFLNRFRDPKDIGHAPEIISLYLKRNKECMAVLDQIQNMASESKLFYYWQCIMEKRNLNRVLAGLYLWKCGAAGISPYCYQHMPVYPNSPFNDFDEWEPSYREGGIDRPFKDHMTTYPAENGVISTLQWEGLAEGITDFKYLFTLHDWLEKASTSQAPEAAEQILRVRERLRDFLSRVDLMKIEINNESEIEPYQTIAPHEYEDFRNEMIDHIQALMHIVDRQSTPEKHVL